MKCSLRLCFLSTAFLLVFVMSVLFTYSHHSIAYLDPGGLGGIHRVKLVPGYAGVRRLGHGGLYPRGCACRRCPEDAADAAAAWFDSRYDGRVSPVWTKENMELPPDVQRWWMVSVPPGAGPQRFGNSSRQRLSPACMATEWLRPGLIATWGRPSILGLISPIFNFFFFLILSPLAASLPCSPPCFVPRLGSCSISAPRPRTRSSGEGAASVTSLPVAPQMLQPQFKSHNTQEVLSKLFQIVPGENPYRWRDPRHCRRCAVVGNSGNLRGSGYGPEIDGHDFVMR